MYNWTMFNKIGKYQDKEFWEKYPYFYIHKPDNTEMKYQIYSVGIIKETSTLYSDYMAEGDAFEEYIKESKECGLYETNVNDKERLVVFGVKISEKYK